jgi:predicted outer membrane repeat protein
LLDDEGLFLVALHLNDVILEGNSALIGGGLYASVGTIDLQNTMVRANVAGGAGGGIHASSGSTLSLCDSQVYSNNAGIGGGVSLEGVLNARIERSKIYSNTASVRGGGIALNPPGGLLTLVDSNLHDNFAGFGGGAIAADSTLILSRTVLNANHAVNRGGGIYTENGATLSLQESTLSRNTAQFGGAIDYEGDSPSGALTLVNSTLSGNSVTHDGGGIYAAWSARLSLLNATVAGNQAVRPFNQLHPVRGGGMFITSTAGVVAQNSLIADNLSGNTITPPTLDDCFGPLHSLGYNLIETTTNCLISGTPLGNVTGQDPALGPLQNNGGSTLTQAPLSGGPAIDRGDNAACPAIDQRGFHRPIGSMCDIGAVEVGPYVFLPLVLR